VLAEVIAHGWVILFLLAGPGLGLVIAYRRNRAQLLICVGLIITWEILCLLMLKFNYWIPIAIPIVFLQTITTIIILRDYLLLKAENQALQYQATYDALTQVPNRRRFDEYFAQEWRRMSREKSSLSLIICDVDFFKLYNDSYGHQAGDLCLKKVAQALKEAIKRPGDLVARYGGEEFVVVLPHTSLDGAIYVAQQIRFQVQSLQINHRTSTVGEHVTLSLGVACTVPTSDLPQALFLKAADEALYHAKRQGRDRYHLAADLN
jgi:diguanylate cyclase (GGDEF)-like protein